MRKYSLTVSYRLRFSTVNPRGHRGRQAPAGADRDGAEREHQQPHLPSNSSTDGIGVSTSLRARVQSRARDGVIVIASWARGSSSVGRAAAFQAACREFDSRLPAPRSSPSWTAVSCLAPSERAVSAMLDLLVLDGRSGRRPGLLRPFRSRTTHSALTGPRGRSREGPVRSRSPHVLRHPRARARVPSRRRGPGLHRAHPRPGRGHPPRPRPAATSWPAPRPAPARPPRSCCPCSSASPADATRPAAAHPRARPGPDPRARAPGRGERPRLRPPLGRPLHRHLRRRRLRAAGPRAAARRRTSSWPRPAGCSTTSASARSTCRRSRSSSSTRPTGCSTWASSATSAGCSRSCRRSRQNLLFSATFSEEIRSLASGFLHDPATVQVTPRNSAAPLVTQVVHPVDRERKRELLSHLMRTGDIDQALVFTRTKHGANRLAEQLGAGRHRGRGHPRQQEPGPARARAGRLQGRPDARSSSRPRSPRAAWTSTGCPTSSTSSCRWSPRTTSTASAGRAAPARRATPSRSCASTSASCCARSRAAGRPDPARGHRGLRARPLRSAPSRSCVAAWDADDPTRGPRAPRGGAPADRGGYRRAAAFFARILPSAPRARAGAIQESLLPAHGRPAQGRPAQGRPARRDDPVRDDRGPSSARAASPRAGDRQRRTRRTIPAAARRAAPRGDARTPSPGSGFARSDRRG